VAKDKWILIDKIGEQVLKNVKGDLFEIGIGRSTGSLIRLKNQFERNLYCFDKQEKLCNWAKDQGCKAFQGPSLSSIKKFPEIPIALGLIDGRHEAATVRQELAFFLELLSIHGIIFLHDTYLQTDERMRDESDPRGAASDVYKVRQEMEQDDRVQTFTWPYTAGDCGLTMVMKLDPDRAYYRK